MDRRKLFPALLLLGLLQLRTFAASPIQERADRFLTLANAGYQAVFRVNSEAQWNAMTDVTPEREEEEYPSWIFDRRATPPHSGKDSQPSGLSSGGCLAALLLGHRAHWLCSFVAPCQPPART
jgi:hypothetical protein